MANGKAVLDFGTFPGSTHTSITVTGQTGLRADSAITVDMLRRATADHSEDEHSVERFHVTAGDIVADTGSGGSFTIHGVLVDQQMDPTNTRDPQTHGQWFVAWSWV